MLRHAEHGKPAQALVLSTWFPADHHFDSRQTDGMADVIGTPLYNRFRKRALARCAPPELTAAHPKSPPSASSWRWSFPPASSTAISSIRWLVVCRSAPLANGPSGTAHAQPPGPGLPEHAPSVYTTIGSVIGGNDGSVEGR